MPLRRYLLILCLLWPLMAPAQQIPVIGWPELSKIVRNPSDTLYVINFWATWCAPCVKELPYFEEAAQKYHDKPVRVLLVSLDFVSELDSKLKPFVQRRNLSSAVLLMGDTDYDAWIDRIDKNWGGNIPATLMVNNARKRRRFIAAELTRAELYAQIAELLDEK